MGKTIRFTTFLVLFFTLVRGAYAQSASKVPADLKFTKEILSRFHFAAWVTLQLRDGSTEKFQYDCYPQKPEVERIKCDKGVFARPDGKAWMRSDDWGETGSAADAQTTQELDTDVNVVSAPLLPPTNRDPSQGGVVWRFDNTSKQGSAIESTFEESREHPKPNVYYPKYTFLKASGDTDGRLFLCGVEANLRDDAGIIPVTMRMTYFVPIPAGSKVQVFDKDTRKEKVNTIVGPESGWEITTETSEPPPAR